MYVGICMSEKTRKIKTLETECWCLFIHPHIPFDVIFSTSGSHFNNAWGTQEHLFILICILYLKNLRRPGYREALTKSSDCMFWIPIQCCTTYKLNATQKNTCHIFPPKKIPRIENFKPKKSFNQPLNHLKSGVPATGTTVLL